MRDSVGGYTDTPLAENVYRVEFSPNGFTSKEDTEDFTLLRAAELTIEKGFEVFQVVEWDKRVTQQDIPARIDEPAITLHYSLSKLTIRLLKLSNATADDIRNAREVSDRIRAKHRLPARAAP